MKKQNKPLVSVIMPVHNAGKFLVPAIESILKQTYTNIELIIIDDASTDDSWKIIQTYQATYPTVIRAYQTPKQTNAAGNGATNFGLTKARGEFIARMDADDISYPTRIEKQVSFLLHNPRTILVGSNATIIDGKGKVTGIKRMPLTHEAIYEQYGVIHPIIHPSVMIRRSMLPDPNKLYAMRWSVNDDYYTFFTLLEKGEFQNIEEPLVKYRIHGNNLSLLEPKKKFFNSVHIRMEAVKHLNYNMSIRSWSVMLMQTLLIIAIPERLIVPSYMAIRGISNPIHQMGKTWKKRIAPLFRSPIKIRYTVNG